MTPQRLAALARRHAETLIAAAVALLLARAAVLAALAGGWLIAALWWAGAVAAALWARAALVGRRLAARLARAPDPGPGVVAVEEGRITYFGPERGGTVALDALAAVSLAAGTERALWRLETADGRALDIPSDALGAERLPDALAALPDFDPEAAARAARGAPGAPVAVWRHPTAGRSGRG